MKDVPERVRGGSAGRERPVAVRLEEPGDGALAAKVEGPATAEHARLGHLADASHRVGRLRGLQAAADARTLQGVFSKNRSVYDASSKKLPSIHGVKPADLEKLARSDVDFGELKGKPDVETALMKWQEAQAPVAEAKVPLVDSGKSFKVVAAFPGHGLEFKDAETVDVTCSLDWGQGKHDPTVAGGARKKGGGTRVREGWDYAGSAKEVVLGLLAARAEDLGRLPEQEGLDFSIQKEVQSDGLHYEISAAWEVKPKGGYHVLVYYHCYPPRS